VVDYAVGKFACDRPRSDRFRIKHDGMVSGKNKQQKDGSQWPVVSKKTIDFTAKLTQVSAE